MALAAIVNMGGRLNSVQPVATVSARASWGITIVDAKGGTVQSASDLIRPLSVTSSNIAPIKLSRNSTRILIRGRYNQDASGGTHAGKVRIFGIYGEPSVASGVVSWSETAAGDGTNEVPQVIRVDQATSDITLTVDLTNDVRVGNFKYTAPFAVDSSILVDALGCDYIMGLLATQSDLTGGTPAAAVQIGVL